MTEKSGEAQEPTTAQGQDQGESIGGEVRVREGSAPRIMRWLAYILFVWAILYLVIHPRVEHRIFLWVWAGLLTAWLLFFALTKRPVDP